jgi:thiamine biosynthesis lipoprotein ApbE
VDLGCIDKGHALDLQATRQREAGVLSAIQHGVTISVLAIGRPPGRPGWRVAIGPRPSATVVTLADRALSVSDPARQRDPSGASHILDPRGTEAARAKPWRRGTEPASRGRPPSPCAVAVMGPSARLADAWTTALAVIGSRPPAFPCGYDAQFLGGRP